MKTAHASRCVAVLTALVLWTSSWCAQAEQIPFEQLLEEADHLRSLDPGAFDSKLSELTSRTGEASPAQLEHLQYLKAYQLAYSGRYDLAIQQASRLFETSEIDALRFRAGLLVANSHAATRDFSNGLAYLESSLELLPNIHDRQLRHDGSTVAALLYNQVGQYELGHRLSEDILASEPSERSACFAGYLRMEAMRELDLFVDPPSAVEALIAKCAALNEALAANLARSQLSRMLAQSGDLKSAISVLEDNLPEITATRYPRLVSEIQSLLAEHLLATGDTAGAERRARLAIAASSDTQFSMPVVVAHHTLYEIALMRGDMAEALEHYRNYAAADKAYLDDAQAKQMAYQMVRHETNRKSQEIALLNRQNEVLALEKQASALATRNTQLLVALLAVLLGTMALWAWKTKRAQVLFRRLAETDALTGISNRMHFSHRAEEALAFCRKDGEEAGLVMFDLDEFKSINDRFGHATGDWVLAEVAKVCADVCRKNDRFGRLGGEEFAFLLVGCDLPSSVALAQSCRKRIAAIDTSPTGHVFNVTASFGVAGTHASGYDFLQLLSRADDALYQAKHAGRDRVRTHGLQSDTTEIAAT
ncbi:GGDEF domain-containing protein [Arenimonas aestuarii]